MSQLSDLSEYFGISVSVISILSHFSKLKFPIFSCQPKVFDVDGKFAAIVAFVDFTD